MGSIDHVLTVLAVTDVQRSVAFYEQVFGWPRRQDFPIYVELELPGGRGLAFYERGSFGINTGQVPLAVADGALTSTELYLRCEDLDGTITRLVSAGARALRPRMRKDWGDDVAYFADPEGNVIAVAQRMTSIT
jgi:predicted enzyme related to lactoylglutathione lyase